MASGGPHPLVDEIVDLDLEPAGGAASAVPLRRWLMAASLVVLNLVDVLITKWILALGGEEQNPIMEPIIHHPTAPILVKLGLAMVVGVLVVAAPRTSRFADVAVGLTIALYTAVIGWNVAVLLQGIGAAA